MKFDAERRQVRSRAERGNETGGADWLRNSLCEKD
jgi:hypothetical protein